MLDVVLLKQTHIALAFFTIIFFAFRFLLNELSPHMIQHRFFKTAPHIIDTLLLATGVMLAWIYKVTPLDALWFLVKIVFIFLYIICGFIAMKSRSRNKRISSAVFGFLFISLAIYLAQQKPFW
ncbi:MAG: SirB2 family protein [Nitrincola sp.]|nr:SirB2 family protein [Nitrincola sp.]